MRNWLLIGLVTISGFFSKKIEATTGIDLLANPKFANFIEAFEKISRASATISLDEGRRLSTEFFLPNDVVREDIKRIEDVEISGKDRKELRSFWRRCGSDYCWRRECRGKSRWSRLSQGAK